MPNGRQRETDLQLIQETPLVFVFRRPDGTIITVPRATAQPGITEQGPVTGLIAAAEEQSARAQAGKAAEELEITQRLERLRRARRRVRRPERFRRTVRGVARTAREETQPIVGAAREAGRGLAQPRPEVETGRAVIEPEAPFARERAPEERPLTRAFVQQPTEVEIDDIREGLQRILGRPLEGADLEPAK